MISERVYRALLALYPAEHRREYVEPMVQLFRDRMRRDGGGVRTLGVWARMVFDLVGSAFTERKEGAMLESAMVKRTAVRSAGFLLWSLIGGICIYVLTTLAVLTAGLASLLTGWYPFAIEGGPLGFLGYTMQIDNRINFSVGWEFTLPGFLVLAAAAGLLRLVGPMKTLRTSFWS